MADQVFIGIDQERVLLDESELSELTAKQKNRNELAEAALKGRKDARESALAKLAALGLTESEIAAL